MRCNMCVDITQLATHVAAHAVVEVDAEAVTAPAHVAEGAVERVRAGVVEVPAVAAVVARLRRRADGAAPADGPARAAGAAGHLRHGARVHGAVAGARSRVVAPAAAHELATARRGDAREVPVAR